MEIYSFECVYSFRSLVLIGLVVTVEQCILFISLFIYQMFIEMAIPNYKTSRLHAHSKCVPLTALFGNFSLLSAVFISLDFPKGRTKVIKQGELSAVPILKLCL